MPPSIKTKSSKKGRMECPCGCRKTVTKRTAHRHMKGKTPITLKASLLAEQASNLGKSLRDITLTAFTRKGSRSSGSHNSNSSSPSSTHSFRSNSHSDISLTSINNVTVPSSRSLKSGSIRENNGDLSQLELFEDSEEVERECTMEGIEARMKREADSRRRFQPTVEDYSSSDEEDENNLENEIYNFISEWDTVKERTKQRHPTSADDIDEDDLNTLRAFALKIESHLSEKAFAKLPYAFPKAGLSLWKSTHSFITQLSAIQPEVYECCIKSCKFIYLPIIPRLKAYLTNPKMAAAMQYHAKEHEYVKGEILDVMDGEVYRSLLGKKVEVDGGKKLSHTYFEDHRDIALGLSTDGFAPF
ncbi:hypothetical protein C8Q75DRAFT_802765 [Abortiporus biennis]|nr:hypothetical protein C8Q75DRAFT_802765 [Abortiporus biennis]